MSNPLKISTLLASLIVLAAANSAAADDFPEGGRSA